MCWYYLFGLIDGCKNRCFLRKFQKNIRKFDIILHIWKIRPIFASVLGGIFNANVNLNPNVSLTINHYN